MIKVDTREIVDTEINCFFCDAARLVRVAIVVVSVSVCDYGCVCGACYIYCFIVSLFHVFSVSCVDYFTIYGFISGNCQGLGAVVAKILICGADQLSLIAYRDTRVFCPWSG